MYPFNVLIVKKNHRWLYRVVYQQNQNIKLYTNNVTIDCCSCPQLSVSEDENMFFLRGRSEGNDHSVTSVVHTQWNTKETLLLINQELKKELLNHGDTRN